jgi:exopolysaccharide/PEP-CTERM locus tyrosine autokinase
MSLVEQAIARMRNQANAAAAKVAAAASTSSAPASPAAPVMNRVAAPSKEATRIVIDRLALRAKGYLAEEGKEKQFANHFRRIKRPLVDKAMSNDTAVELRVIMVTSALPGEGKTFSSLNLALSMAQERDVSVLLVDCDVAKRHIGEILGLRDEAGLLDALVDESLDVESLVVGTNVPGFSILPAGRRVETTAELLSSKRMRQVMAGFCVHNPRRIVLLDSPPLLITNEGRALLKVAGQIVLVMRAGHTPRHAVEDAVALFGPQHAGGIILNHVGGGGADGYYYGYGSYYGTDANGA